MSSETCFSSTFAIPTIAAACAHTPWSAMSFSRSVGRLGKRRYPALHSVVLSDRQKDEDDKMCWMQLTLS